MGQSVSDNPSYKPIRLSEVLSAEEIRRFSEPNNAIALGYVLWHLGLLLSLSLGIAYFYIGEKYAFALITYFMYCAVFNFLGTAGAMHEFCHGRVFSSKIANAAIYRVLGYVLWINPSMFKATHFHHHREFLAEGDVEGHIGNNTKITSLDFVFLMIPRYRDIHNRVKYNYLTMRGKIESEKLRNIVLKANLPAIKLDALITFGLHFSVVGCSIIFANPLYVFLLTLPTFFARYPVYVLARSQHNVSFASEEYYNQVSGSISLNLPWPIRLLYWDMNYHFEHHLAPVIPHHRLKSFSELLRSKASIQSYLNKTNLFNEIEGKYVKRS